MPSCLPPGPSSPAALGASGRGPAAPLHFLAGLAREYGDAVHYVCPFGPVWFFNHPDHMQSVLLDANFGRTSLVTALLGQGLLGSEGAWWRQQRRLVQPTFHERCLPGFAPTILKPTRELLQRWESQYAGGAAFDLSLELRQLTLEIIFRALFSQGLGDQAGPLCDAVTTVIEDLGGIAGVFFHVPKHFSPARNAVFREARATVDRLVYGLIAERRALPEPPRDLLTVLLQGRDEATSQPLSDEALRDEIVTMIIAGHETTAITLVWALHLLSLHPATETKLHEELDCVLAGRFPTVEDVPALPYTRMVMEETMRHYPAVWCMMRKTTAPTELAGYAIPAHSLVVVSPYTTHRHPDFWEAPEEFRPERFAPEHRTGRHRFAYVPFAAGRHVCVGQGFAMLEMPLLLAALGQRYRVRFLPGQPLETLASLTLRPFGGTQVQITPRSTAN